ncbi:hypothetical protein [Lysobacter gummosus]|nr:hypothetical protein LG3211_3231 [Lysobacter gummosus]
MIAPKALRIRTAADGRRFSLWGWRGAPCFPQPSSPRRRGSRGFRTMPR